MSEAVEGGEPGAAPASTESRSAAGQRSGAGRKRVGALSPRRKAREFALQGLYEWLIGGADAGVVDAHVREQEGFAKCDAAHFDVLLHGCILEASELDALLVVHLDRKTEQLSPVEHGVLLIGAYELKHCIDIPYKVAINEAVELAKSFGGTDGHKYVNGVLDQVAPVLRGAEVEAMRARRG
ncbi:MAG: transcription antitermination factor NusB [Pseudomonadota bacterium]|nr:transcription antitermination factor NusB [Pseudomonadota bacterium]